MSYIISKMGPLVSILIPAFNADQWIADSIKSALGQTWHRKEIIVVDDGSTDRTLSIAQQFASKTVSVVSQPNQGAAVARNNAFAMSRGDYMQWLDVDDLLAPDKITKQLEALNGSRDKRLLLSSAWGYFMYRPSKADFRPTSLWGDLSPVEWLLRKMDQNVYMSNATWLVSRELTEAAGPWDTRLWVDIDGEYFARVILASNGVRFVPQARAFYRRVPGSLSHIGGSERKLEALFLSMKLHISYLRSVEDSERARAACLKYLQAGLFLFYPERLDIVKQAEQIAADLGGRLEVPRVPWKYAWIERICGAGVARRAQILMLVIKVFLISSWDKAMFHWENRNLANS